MVDPEIRDGHRIASLLEAEIDGSEQVPLDTLVFEWGESDDKTADRDAGGESPGFVLKSADSLVATGTIQPDRVLLEFSEHQAKVAEAAERVELRVRPKATRPPATLVFVERGAAVKRVIDVLRESLPGQ